MPWNVVTRVSGFITGSPVLQDGEASQLKQKNALIELFDRIIVGRKFLLRSEIPLKSSDFHYRHFKEYAREKGITIIDKKPCGAVKTVMDWLRGIEAEGRLPGEKEIAEKMGDRAFGYLMRVINGETMQDIGLSEGMTRERIRQIINRGAQRAVNFLAKTLGREGQPGQKLPGKPSGWMAAKKEPLLQARAAKKITVEELARKAGCSKETIYRLQRGKRAQYRTAARIAEALNCKVWQLFAEAGGGQTKFAGNF